MSKESKRVLIVDDEKELRELVGDILLQDSIEIDQADDGRTACELLGWEKYDLVICDIKMKHMNGLDCLGKAQSEGVTTPFVFLSGSADYLSLMKAIRLGAADFILKPFKVDEIRETIKRTLKVSEYRQAFVEKLNAVDASLYKAFRQMEKEISLLKGKADLS